MFIEEYWSEVLESRQDQVQKLAAAVTDRNYVFTKIINTRGTNYSDNLRKVIQEKPSDLIIVSPLLSAEVIALAPQFPAKRFLILPAPRLNEIIPANVVLAGSSRTNAFYEIGKMTGQVLARDYNAAFGNRVGMILSGITGEEREIKASFERGFSLFMQTDALITEEIGTATDRVKAIRAVENLFNRGVRVFFVKTYGLNPACLEKIRSLGGYFIVEDFSYFNLFDDRLLFSIEDDLEKAVGDFLDLSDDAKPGKIPLEASIVTGLVLKDFQVSH